MKPEHQDTFRIMFAEEPVPEHVRIFTEAAEAVLDRLGGGELGVQELAAVVGAAQLLTGQAVIENEKTATQGGNAGVPQTIQSHPTQADESEKVTGKLFHPDPPRLTLIPGGSTRSLNSRMGPGSRVVVTYYGRRQQGIILEGLAEKAHSWRVKLDFDLLPWRDIDADTVSPE